MPFVPFVLFLQLSLVLSQNTNCAKVPQPDASGHYDISQVLTTAIEEKVGFSTFSISICKNSLSCGFCTSAGYCEFYDSGQFQFTDCIGQFSGITGLTGGAGVEVIYTGGDMGGAGRLKILCDPSAPTTPVPIIDEAGKLTTFSSPFACPTAGGGDTSPGTIFLVLLLVTVIVYFAAGVAWNKYRNDASGADLVPHREFWVNFGALIKEGCQFCWSKLSGRN